MNMLTAAQALGNAIAEDLSIVDLGSITLGKRGLAQVFYYLEQMALDACVPFLEAMSSSQRLGPLIEASELDTLNYWLSMFARHNRLDLLDEFLTVNLDSIRQRFSTDRSPVQRFWLLWHVYLAGVSVDEWIPSLEIDELMATIPVEFRAAVVGLMELLSAPFENATAVFSLGAIADQVAVERSPTIIALSLRAVLAHYPPREVRKAFAVLDLDTLQARWASIQVEAVDDLFHQTFELLRAAIAKSP
jgi:hypothetical protein